MRSPVEPCAGRTVPPLNLTARRRRFAGIGALPPPNFTARRRRRFAGIGAPPQPTFDRRAAEVKRDQLFFQFFVTSFIHIATLLCLTFSFTIPCSNRSSLAFHNFIN